MMTLIRLLSLVSILSIAACGGGGGNSGTAPFGGGTGTGSGGGTTPTPSAANLVLTLSASNIANDGSQTVTATALAVDTNNNTIVGVPVTIGVDTGVATPSAVVTNSSGAVTATIGIGSDFTNRTINVTASSEALRKTAQLQVSATASGAGAPALTVQLSGSTVTSASPATVTATLLDRAGSPVTNGVVAFSTLRGNLAKLSVVSALTNGQGVATASLSSAASGVQGADQVIATATVNSVQVQGSAGFTVTAQAPTINLNPGSSTLTFSSAPRTLTATVLDASGNLVANQAVTFAAANDLVRLNVGSALTSAAGTAVVLASPVSAATSGAEIITASATVNGVAVQAVATVQVNAQAPSMALVSLSSSAIGATSPATLTVEARDLNGALLPNAVVTFTSQAGLATFTPATQVTGGNGRAATVISPKTPGTSGADTITASTAVQGLTASLPTVVQFNSSAPSGTPTLDLALSTTSISAATPATVTATLRDVQGNGVAGQVMTFRVVRGLALTNVATALTNASGQAVVVMSPTSSTSAGADDVTASVSYAGVPLQQTQGFQVQATAVTLGALTPAATPLSAYGQTTLTLPINGAGVTSPVALTFTSSCVTLGKATLSPASITATSAQVIVQFRDNGCGAVQASDQIQAVVTSTGATATLALPIQSPTTASVSFVKAEPEQIFLRGSGFTQNSLVTFQVNDLAGNPLPNIVVELRLQTGAGGVTMESRGVESVNPPSPSPFTATSNALGQVSVRVNSGSVPTPVRIHAQLAATPAIATVSSNLSVAVGLPSQLNFSLSQGVRNIEGANIDGTPNTYQIIAADRSGNPVPAGTSINFVAEGGQIEAIKQTQLVSGIARTTANFVSAEPRPADGRVTITVYALGEESFLDLDGDNFFDAGEPFQDLGNIFKDRNFDGLYDSTVDEFVSLTINNGSACTPPASPLLTLDPSIPSVPATCDTAWSGAGQVYVRRATETVLSTSAGRPLWASTRGLDASCTKLPMQVGPRTSQTQVLTVVDGGTWYGGLIDTLNFIVGDANALPRLNPMAAGTTISASTPTKGMTVSLGGGSPVPSTTEASSATVVYELDPNIATSGIVFVSFTSPSGFKTTVSVPVDARNPRPSVCP